MIIMIVSLLIPAWDVIPGRIYFNRLCSNSGGQIINHTIKAVGYYDGSFNHGCGYRCVQRLTTYVEGHNLFIETHVTIPWDERLVDDPGYYRFYLNKEFSPACKRYQKLNTKGSLNIKALLPKGTCVASVKIKKPSAIYEYSRFKINHNYSEVWGVGLAQSKIFNRQTGEILSRSNEYLYYGNWISRLLSSISGPKNFTSCPDKSAYTKYGLHEGIIYLTLRTAKSVDEKLK